jgi:hypothetical protein
MKSIITAFALLAICSISNAQNLDSLFENGKNNEIVQAYNSATRSFDNNELEIVAAAFDKLHQLDDEQKVLLSLCNNFPLFLIYTIPANYLFYVNFINAGRMEAYKSAIQKQYLESIKQTALGEKILEMFYEDQAVRQKYEYYQYCKRNSIKQLYDSLQIVKDWRRIDSVNVIRIKSIVDNGNGFPSKANIGIIGTNSLFIVMQHLDTNHRDHYDKYLLDAACRKDITMVDYAMFKSMTLVTTHQIPDAMWQQTLDSLSETKCR